MPQEQDEKMPQYFLVILVSRKNVEVLRNKKKQFTEYYKEGPKFYNITVIFSVIWSRLILILNCEQ